MASLAEPAFFCWVATMDTNSGFPFEIEGGHVLPKFVQFRRYIGSTRTRCVHVRIKSVAIRDRIGKYRVQSDESGRFGGCRDFEDTPSPGCRCLRMIIAFRHERRVPHRYACKPHESSQSWPRGSSFAFRRIRIQTFRLYLVHISTAAPKSAASRRGSNLDRRGGSMESAMIC